MTGCKASANFRSARNPAVSTSTASWNQLPAALPKMEATDAALSEQRLKPPRVATRNNNQPNHSIQVNDQTKQPNQKKEKAMKHIFTGFSLIGAFALLALGCAANTQQTENLLSAAGFRTVIAGATEWEKLLRLRGPGSLADLCW
jgi:hypothetical protein